MNPFDTIPCLVCYFKKFSPDTEVRWRFKINSGTLRFSVTFESYPVMKPADFVYTDEILHKGGYSTPTK